MIDLKTVISIACSGMSRAVSNCSDFAYCYLRGETKRGPEGGVGGGGRRYGSRWPVFPGSTGPGNKPGGDVVGGKRIVQPRPALKNTGSCCTSKEQDTPLRPLRCGRRRDCVCGGGGLADLSTIRGRAGEVHTQRLLPAIDSVDTVDSRK